VREKSLSLQQDIIKERQGKDLAATPQYVRGDLVLFGHWEGPCTHLPEKLSTAYLGPYEVVSQSKNDVTCKHIVLNTEHIFHVARLKPFFGTREEALKEAQLDQDQFFVRRILHYTGNPHLRTIITFTLEYVDGDVSTVPYTSTEIFQQYIHEQPELLPLRYAAVEAKKQITIINKQPITEIQPGDTVHVDMRYFDGMRNVWFDGQQVHQKSKRYVTDVRYTRYTSVRNTKIEGIFTQWNRKCVFSHYDVVLYGAHKQFDENKW
jgi:hypothetical protein